MTPLLPRESGLLRYRLLRCMYCNTRNWIIGNTAPTCTCGQRDWWEDQTFFARSQGPGFAPTPVMEEL